MQAEALLRRQKIEDFFERQPQTVESIVDAAQLFWGKIATPLVRMVGDLGAASLFERCVDLVSPEFPWLPQSHISHPSENAVYQSVWDSLHTQECADARNACINLFTTFFELLAALIGERLTAKVFLLGMPAGVQQQ